jgi:transcription initiation factor TFIIB
LKINIKSRSNKAIIGACMLIACREHSVPRTFKEICAVTDVSQREIGRCFKMIRSISHNSGSKSSVFSSTDLIVTDILNFY